MLSFLKSLYFRYLTNPQAVTLLFLLLSVTLVIVFAGKILGPLFVALIIAYLLEGPILKLKRMRCPRLLAVNLVFFLFITLFAFTVLWLLPLITQQISEFLNNLPEMIGRGQQLVYNLQEKYPLLLSEDLIRGILAKVKEGLDSFGNDILSFSLEKIPTLISIIVYFILVPLMIFLLLKDKDKVLQYIANLFPSYRDAANQLWKEMDEQIGNYVRGKIFEILIVAISAFILFSFLQLNYSVLLAITVGLSVLIPYIGAAVVTLPVALVGYAQWGLSAELYWTIGWYLVLQFLDGNVLVPILFSEAVNLHPLVIITAILFCGGIWGFWGVFFAIPFATLIKTLIDIWPENKEYSNEQAEQI